MSAHAAPGIGASGNLLSRLARLAGFLLAVMDRYRHVMEKWLGGGPGESATPARGWKDIEPRLHAEAYVFVSALEVPPGVQPFAVIREDEATTLVTTRDEADRAGLGYGYVAARITLTINSTLSDIGLTAAVSRVLADAGISCNVIAGLAHDHLFVAWDRGPEAASLLRQL